MRKSPKVKITTGSEKKISSGRMNKLSALNTMAIAIAEKKLSTSTPGRIWADTKTAMVEIMSRVTKSIRSKDKNLRN
jgi:hypothetical protein